MLDRSSPVSDKMEQELGLERRTLRVVGGPAGKWTSWESGRDGGGWGLLVSGSRFPWTR